MSCERRWYLAAVAAVMVGAALTLPFRDLWDPDEARYATVAREMLASGQWLVPQLNGEPYPHKPPVYLWLVAGLRASGLPWTIAGVLPALAAFLALLALLPRLARSVGLERVQGYLAGALLASSPLVAIFALAARMDMLLTLSNAVALLLLARLLGVADQEEHRQGLAHWAFWAVVGLGVLVKGPVALALPVATALSYRLLAPSRPSLRPVFAGFGPFLGLAVVLAWLVPAALVADPGYLHEILIRQTAGRVWADPFAHPSPPYVYLVAYPLIGLPWSFLAVLATVRALRRRSSRTATFLSCAFASGFLLFSMISGKMVFYLLPLFPAALLLVADALRSGEPGTRWSLGAGAGLLGLVGAAAALAPMWRTELAGAWPLVASGALVMATPALLTLGTGRGRRAPATALLVAGLAFLSATLPLGVLAMNSHKSVRVVAERLIDLEKDAPTALSFRFTPYSLSLYASRSCHRIEALDELDAALAQGRWVLIYRRDWDRLPALARATLTSEGPFPYRSRSVLLIRSRQQNPAPVAQRRGDQEPFSALERRTP